MKGSSSFQKLTGGVIGLLVVVCMAIAANIILANMTIRKDLTEEKLYRLSNGTREVLKGLKQPVTLKFFFNGSNPEVPVNLKQYAQTVDDLLAEYRLAGRGSVIVEKYDPKPDSDAEDWAQRYGVSGQSVGFMGPSVYIGLVAVMGDNEASLPALDPRMDNLLEYNLTRMIARVANPKKPVVGVISSLPVLGGERPPYPMPDQREPPKPWFGFKDLKQDYEVRKLETAVESIDKDIDALVVVHPKDLSDKTLYAIDQFVLGGGRLLAFLDPLCIAEAETQTMPPMQQFSQRSSNLEKLLKAWGVTYEPEKVVADLEATSRLRVSQDNRIEDSPVWLSLRKRHVNAKDILTSQIESIMMPYAGALAAQPSDDVKVTSLIASSESSALVDAMTAQFGVEGVRRNFKSGLKRLDLAVRLQGKLKTAFPDGKPKAEEKSDDKPDAEKKDATPPSPDGESLKESAHTSTVMLFGDVDMLYDRFCVQDVNFFGFTAAQPMNDNLALFANAVEQMAGSTALAAIRTRGRIDRPFDVVLDLQRKAQEKYMEEETRLQQKLEEAQRRLNELQSQKDQKQRFLLSPEQKTEIENFQKQVARTKQELKHVRRSLREDIETLGVWVKIINILLMPILVAVAGIVFGVYRRRKTRRLEPRAEELT